MSYINKIVLVTGAASGIGEGVALCFAKKSARLALIDSNEKELKKTAEKCEKLSKTKVLHIEADLSKDDDVQNAVEKTIKEYSRIDVVVNCAGIFRGGNLLDPDAMENFDITMAVNLRAIVSMTEKVAPELVKTKGSIINISSICAIKNVPETLMYTASKAGLYQFTRGVALELAAENVRVNAILPGYVRTNIFLNNGTSAEDNENNYKTGEQLLPIKHVLSADEVASLVDYLASDKAVGITGSCYLIDSGYSLT